MGGLSLGGTGPQAAIAGVAIASRFATASHAGTAADPFPLAAFQAAVAAFGANAGAVYVDAVFDVTANYAVPANVTLIFRGPGLLKVETGVTLTLNGPIDAPNSQIFSPQGTAVIAFGAGFKGVVQLEW